MAEPCAPGCSALAVLGLAMYGQSLGGLHRCTAGEAHVKRISPKTRSDC